MELSKRQQRLIRQIVRWRTNPPTLGPLLRRLLLMTICWSLVLTLLVVFTGGLQSPYLLYSIGVMTGFLGVNAAALRLALIRWSVYREIIDWPKVESLAASLPGPGV
jgi:hypothetical protein